MEEGVIACNIEKESAGNSTETRNRSRKVNIDKKCKINMLGGCAVERIEGRTSKG